MTAEQWRVVADLPEFEVSNLGGVRDAITKLPKKPALNSNGYWRLRIYRPGGDRRKYVHTAVCEAFNGARPEGLECRHLNGEPLDNRAVNLAWGTRSENMHDRVAHGSHWQANKTHCHAGHPFNDKNTYMRPRGTRHCRTCTQVSREKYMAKARRNQLLASTARP